MARPRSMRNRNDWARHSAHWRRAVTDAPAERVWYGSGGAPSTARALLTPFAWAFGGAVRARNALYDAGIFTSIAPAIPVVSVGNLTVGGTGKTPFAAHVALRLLEAGANPALVMRGVGHDESRAYAVLAHCVRCIAYSKTIRHLPSAIN